MGSRSAGQEQKPDEQGAFMTDSLLSQEKTGQAAMIGTEALLDFLRDRQDIRLVGIDGLPVSGKSTLADRLIETFAAEVIYLDDFVLPQDQWPEPITPGFPFPYIRHEAFFAAVETLAATGACRYQLYDWESGALGSWKEVHLGDKLVVVEGVSALAERLAGLYDLKIWVESDAATTLSASLERGVGAWERQWRELFMPSVEAYLQTRPKDRADITLAGRGARI
jgi:uridine kinase